MKQLVLDMDVGGGPSLDNFCAGANDAVLSHLRLWLGLPGSHQRWAVPTYVWGAGGSGKTHLLKAASHALQARGLLLGWLDDSEETPAEFNEHWVAVLMDDVHAYGVSRQQTAFNWFVNAQTQQIPVLAAGSLPPADLKLRDDLRTRVKCQCPGPRHCPAPGGAGLHADPFQPRPGQPDGTAGPDGRVCPADTARRYHSPYQNHDGQRMTTKLALFDLDHTLIPVDSDYEWGVFTTKLGWNDATEFTRRNEAFFAQYKDGTLDIRTYIRFATAALRQQGAILSEAAHVHFMRAVVQNVIMPQALALVRQHQDAGDRVVIVTATNEFVVRPIAQAFGVAELIAINLARDPATGWFNGEILGTPSFREGKVARVQEWLDQQQLDWNSFESTFYSDSINDLPLLERVSYPVATNPDDRLRAIALARGWRILELF